jgi:hypothetical protein
VILVEHKFDRRSFLRVAGTSLSIGALYSVFPALTRSAGAEAITRTLAQLNGEPPAPFSFIQLSDTHVGFNGPPDSTGRLIPLAPRHSKTRSPQSTG